MNRREFVTALVALPALVRPAAAEVTSIKLGKQYGLPFLPQMVMEDHKLIEKHAERLGVSGLSVGWQTMGGPGALNDGLLSGRDSIRQRRVAFARHAVGQDLRFAASKCARCAPCNRCRMCW